MPDHHKMQSDRGLIDYRGAMIEYEVHRSARRRATTEIRVRIDRVHVYVPHTMDVLLVRELVRDRAPWILEERARLAGAASGTPARPHDLTGIKFDRDEIEYGGATIQYEIRRSRRRVKTIEVAVRPSGVRVNAPWAVSDGEVQAFVRERATWILDRLSKLAEIEPIRFADGETLPFLGHQIPMVFEIVDLPTPEVRFDAVRFRVSEPPGLAGQQRVELIGGAFMAWYYAQAMDLLPDTVERWRRVLRHGQQPRVLIRNQRRRWGSCATDGTLRFNWRVMTLDTDLIDYVVVHELAHLQVRNHSADFWRVVRQAIPDVQQRRDRVKRIGLSLQL